MAGNVRVALNMRGLNALMRSQPVQGRLDEVAEAMAADAGEGFEAVSVPHRWTARAYVQVASADGARKQAEDAVLERVLGARR